MMKKTLAGELPFSAIILAAGLSSRFGKPKAFLKFSGKESFLERLLQVYLEAQVNKIVIVVNRDIEKETEALVGSFAEKQNITVVLNNHPEAGRFTSIKLGAAAVEKTSAVFIQNTDNPFTSSSLLQGMMSMLQAGKYVVPVWNHEKGHPALLSPAIAQRIRDTADARANLRELLEEFESMEWTSAEERIHANINTVTEYQKYFVHEETF